MAEPRRSGPNRYREIPYGRINYVSRNAEYETYQAGTFHLVAGFVAAVNASTVVNEQVRAFALALEQLTSGNRVKLAEVHTQIARLMQQAMLEDYEKARARYGRNITPYRLTTRDAGGKLRAALGSTQFYRGTYDGIGFVNVSLLNAVARQWHRLNFGARPRGNYSPRVYQARFGNLVAGSFGYLGEGPSPGFGLPRGYFTAEGAFYPRGGRQIHPTRGIQAWNFLDAGPRVLAQRLGPAYDGLYRDWYASAQRGKGPLSRVVNPPAPRRRSFRP